MAFFVLGIIMLIVFLGSRVFIWWTVKTTDFSKDDNSIIYYLDTLSRHTVSLFVISVSVIAVGILRLVIEH